MSHFGLKLIGSHIGKEVIKLPDDQDVFSVAWDKSNSASFSFFCEEYLSLSSPVGND